MHQNAFGSRAPTGPAAGAYTAPLYPLAGLRGRRGVGKGRGGRGMEGRGRGKKEGKGIIHPSPPQKKKSEVC